MKKIKLFLTVAVTVIAGSASAQLSVVDKGQIHVGTRGTNNSANISIPPTPVEIDGSAKLIIFGNGKSNVNGRIAFGDSDHVLIGEDKGADILALKGDNGLNFRMGNTTYFRIAKSTTFPITTSANFFCAVSAESFVTTSDLRLKTDVTPLGENWRFLSDLNSISYKLLPRPIQHTDEESLDEITEEETAAIPNERTHFGFVAQEVREIFPDLVNEDEEGYLSIDYIGFIPLLVDAYKNLEERNRELEERNLNLEQKVEGILNPAKRVAGVNGVDGMAETVSLSQNRPNPFTERTTIDLTLPSDVSSAVLCIYDMQGTQVMQLPVEGRGKTAVTVDGKSLRAGMYLYSLIADGEEVATKRMILTE